MPSYPFILLAAIFLVVVIVPPLVAAYLDEKRQQLTSHGRQSGQPSDEGSSDSERHRSG